MEFRARRKKKLSLSTFSTRLRVPRGEFLLCFSRARSCRVHVFCLAEAWREEAEALRREAKGVEVGRPLKKKKKNGGSSKNGGMHSIFLMATLATIAFEASEILFLSLPLDRILERVISLAWTKRRSKRRLKQARKRERKKKAHFLDRRRLPKKKNRPSPPWSSPQSPVLVVLLLLSDLVVVLLNRKKNGLALRRLHPREHLRSALRPSPHPGGRRVRRAARAELRPARRRAARPQEGRPGTS